ncbi:radial spoke head protein [Pelomyxa schiedti]|nr:radial spoke head protein [Pelomyxa schiedti]
MSAVMMIVDDTSLGDGGTYTGRLVHNRRDGRGAATWRRWRSGTYDGEWRDNKRHGRGSHRWPNGTTYDGEWHADKRDGWGVYRWPEGSWYEGLWRGENWERGAFHHENGVDVFEGAWSQAVEMQGWGVQRRTVNGNSSNNSKSSNRKSVTTAAAAAASSTPRTSDVIMMETVYEGEWDRDKWHGRGTWRSPDGSGDLYHGKFENGKRSGNGSMLFGGDGGSYVGEWKNDKFHGQGVRLWANGDRYDGKWVCGMENGEGTRTWSRDGSSFTGLWEMGTPKKGTRRWPNGDMFEGTFTTAPQQQSGGSDSGDWSALELQGEGVATLSSSSEGHNVNLLRGILNKNNVFIQQDGGESEPARLQQHKMGYLPPFEMIEALKTEYTKEMNAAKKQWEQVNESNIKQHNQLNQKIEELEQKLQKQQEELQNNEDNDPQFLPLTTMQPVLPELTEAFQLATQFQSQMKASARELLLLQESLANMNSSLQGATQHNEELASHLRDLSVLKHALGKQLEEACESCKKVLGQTLTAQDSEAEIQQCSRNLAELTKKVLGIKPIDRQAPEPSPPQGFSNNSLLLLQSLQESTGCCQSGDDSTTPVEPFRFLGPLTDTLTQLQGCLFEHCTKLVDQHTRLSKELSDQVTLGHNLHKQIEEIQGSCSELMRQHKTKWMLQRGMEGDEQFIALPAVWSQLSQLLPPAQQALVDLIVIVAKSTSSCSSSIDPQKQTPAGVAAARRATLPGCTAATSSPSDNNNSQDTVVVLCFVCEERPPNICFQPCGHIVVCSECSTALKRCTTCRTPIHNKQTLF